MTKAQKRALQELLENEERNGVGATCRPCRSVATLDRLEALGYVTIQTSMISETARLTEAGRTKAREMKGA